jgi:pimeloyl-ACP methyl ester carboxylesterase
LGDPRGLHWFSKDFADLQANDLASQVDADWSSEAYDEIWLLAHSFGALLVRHAYLRALLGYPREGIEPLPWAKHVSRIVLFAGINRGLLSVEQDEEDEPYKRRRKWMRTVIELFTSVLPTHFLVCFPPTS